MRISDWSSDVCSSDLTGESEPDGPIDLGNESYLRSILDSVPDAMVVIDEAGRIISFSAAAERMFGYAEAELVGENVSTLMPSPNRERQIGRASCRERGGR